jgi:hypothetical protein
MASRSAFARSSHGPETHQHQLRPTVLQQHSAHENIKATGNIARMNRQDKCPDAVANIERLLAIADPCCVEGCKRKNVYWTPKGKFCGKHREEAIEAMRLAKVERYGRSV